MATVTLVTHKNYDAAGVAATTSKLAEFGKEVVHGAADTLTLPLNADVGYHFGVTASAAAAVTVAAGSGETVTGDTATAAAIGSRLKVVKNGATTWVASGVTAG